MNKGEGVLKVLAFGTPSMCYPGPLKSFESCAGRSFQAVEKPIGAVSSFDGSLNHLYCVPAVKMVFFLIESKILLQVQKVG
ncbi:hypothetical protein M3202_13215 [Alkalihalobacillus oceani]|uniref:Uncharacterized protein n=1 Tax=Halalkalibacter oceani TaxID=1653776 RepID=A0A9X2IQX9_9BACI|nr:hypothetical protein [Halalkalibacter oceani]MCM3715043.1 hypothetical protein [Halalkalibacter oceani]